jgi:hypothetical protein
MSCRALLENEIQRATGALAACSKLIFKLQFSPCDFQFGRAD